MASDLAVSDQLIAGIISLLLTALMIYFAARIVLDKSSFLAAIGTAFVANLLAGLVAGLLAGAVGGTVALLLGVLVWGLVAAIFYRAKWLQGVVIGVVAWLIWFLVNLAVKALF